MEKRGRSLPTVYFGESTCEGQNKRGTKCAKHAYYREAKSIFTSKQRVLCGIHSNKQSRTTLQKNPKAAQIRKNKLKEHNLAVLSEAAERGSPGTVTCVKLRMLQLPLLQPGVQNVFPNNKHANRTDGFGCPSLSPMRLGPVAHGQSGLPDALNIENYHQFNKCFQFELEENVAEKPKPIFYAKRLIAYTDPVPHRHKYDSKHIRKLNGGNGVNAPAFSIHKDRTGTERHYSYVQSRLFYSLWYERLAKQKPAFHKLAKDLASGINLCICGYDGYQPTEDLYVHYCDGTRPFGHELVLYALLVIEDPAQYPWRRYYREHSELYDPLSFEM